jgi:hypothetical protein
MRYKDSIQCVGAALVAAVRADALALDPTHHGDFYALHIRRGDMAHRVRRHDSDDSESEVMHDDDDDDDESENDESDVLIVIVKSYTLIFVCSSTS